MNWLVVAAVMAVLYLGAFVVCLIPRRWTVAGLFVGFANLFLAFMNSVAPVRGWADPEYAGFTFGLIHAPPGPLVTVAAGSMLLLATFSACVAALNLRGSPMRVVALFDGLIALNLGADLLMSVIRDPNSMKIALGEYLTIGPVPTLLVLALMFVLPLTLCAVWAWRRSSPAPA
jgi:hypothetical protein